ncbi:UNVERIFIED_ORG: hypothetical protein M2328_002738 [Rhodococcus erythropolis]
MNDINTHPAVIAATVAVAVLIVLLAGGRKAAALLAPGWEWWLQRHERRIQRRIRIEAGARMLNDERVQILLDRIDGLHAEMLAQRVELTEQRDEARQRAEQESTARQEQGRQLEQALTEIRELKAGQNQGG